MVRFQISQKLIIETDSINLKFQKYRGITFNFSCFEEIAELNIRSELDLISYSLKQRLTLGIGFEFPRLSDVTDRRYTSQHFVIPLLKGGKMWQMLIGNMERGVFTPVDERAWRNFSEKPLECLICHNYPYDLYPGDFIVNQSILHMKSFIWTDKRRLHAQKKKAKNSRGEGTKKKIIMYRNSEILSWPFLAEHTPKIKEGAINSLGNMAVFSPGEIFTTFIDIVINRMNFTLIQNGIIDKIQTLKKTQRWENITVDDLILMYRCCRRKKLYEVSKSEIRLRKKATGNQSPEEHATEELLIKVIKDQVRVTDLTETQAREIIDWFRFASSKNSMAAAVAAVAQIIKRGDIDSAITQTSTLNKDYCSVGVGVGETITPNHNLDVHRVGRYTRNSGCNSLFNLCSVACGLQKVLPRESKTTAPKKITRSEIGFVDLLNTPDTPRNCGLVLESTLDVVVSSDSTTCSDLRGWLESNFPDVTVVSHPAALTRLDPRFVYVCANQVLYRFPFAVPHGLRGDTFRFEYVASHFGYNNFHRMTQYAMKICFPCIELLKHTRNFWVCTSFSKTMYKIHRDGLLYTSQELETFEVSPHAVSAYADDRFLSLWIGENREFIPNIFGPSVRAIPRPNASHLPRISHAAASAKHFVGFPYNSHGRGNLHQKTLTTSYYCFKLRSSDNIFLPGHFPLVLVAGGFNNPEDGIVVRKSAIERGMFLAQSYETAAIKFNYGPKRSPPVFEATITSGQVLRKGLQVGIFKNVELNTVPNVEKPGSHFIDIFSAELKLVRCSPTGGMCDESSCFSVVWVGKDGDAAPPPHQHRSTKTLRSMAFVEGDPNHHRFRCERLECTNVTHMCHTKLYLIYSCQFTPTVGDKLSTPTSMKGVISELLSDDNCPFVVTKSGECIYPDLIINPQYLKRQALDNIYSTGQLLSHDELKNPYMDSCFSYNVHDSVYYMKLGEEIMTGPLMNPQTGHCYLRPVHQKKAGVVYYDFPVKEYMDEDGFTCVARNQTEASWPFVPHEIVVGSVYSSNYFNVINHKAVQMCQSSKSDEIIRTEFSGTPVRGRKGGGLSIGPQESLALCGIGSERFSCEITQMRSDYTGVQVDPVNENEQSEILGVSSTCARVIDDLNLGKNNFLFKVTKHVTAAEI